MRQAQAGEEVSSVPKTRLTIDQRIQKAREEGYLAGREEANGTVHRLEADLSDAKRLLQDAMAALEKEREANLEAAVENEPIPFWPSKPMLVNGGFYHHWPSPLEHSWSKWQADRPMPNPTQYRSCIHPLCTAVERRPAPKG